MGSGTFKYVHLCAYKLDAGGLSLRHLVAMLMKRRDRGSRIRFRDRHRAVASRDTAGIASRCICQPARV